MELAPEKLIEMLEKGENLPNVILMYGEENYYRSKAAACIKKYVFGSAADEDMEISVFDRDTDLKRPPLTLIRSLAAAASSSSATIKFLPPKKSRKKIWKQFWQTYRSSAICLSA